MAGSVSNENTMFYQSNYYPFTFNYRDGFVKNQLDFIMNGTCKSLLDKPRALLILSYIYDSPYDTYRCKDSVEDRASNEKEFS